MEYVRHVVMEYVILHRMNSVLTVLRIVESVKVDVETGYVALMRTVEVVHRIVEAVQSVEMEYVG